MRRCQPCRFDGARVAPPRLAQTPASRSPALHTLAPSGRRSTMMQIDVEELMDRGRIGRTHIRVLALCALVAFLDGYDLQAMASAIPTLASDWGMAAGELR